MSIAINFAQSILLPVMLGPASFGLYAGIYTNIMVGVGIGRGPIESLIQRGCEANHSIYDYRSFRNVLIASIVLSIFLFIAVSAVQRWKISNLTYLVLSLSVFIGAASGVRRGLLITAGRTSELEVLDTVIRPALFILAAAICWQVGVVDQVFFWLLGASFIISLAAPNVHAFRAFTEFSPGHESAIKPWLALLASGGLSILVKNADVIILGMFLDPPTVGRYFIIARIADIAAFGYSFASARFVHRFAKARRDDQLDHMEKLITRATIFGFAIASSASVAILTLGYLLLPLIDPVLSDYTGALAILLFAQLLNATLGVRGAFLTAIDPRYTLGLKLLLNPAAILMMFLIVPRYGPLGAALVSSTFIAFMQLSSTVLLNRLMIKEWKIVHLRSGEED